MLIAPLLRLASVTVQLQTMAPEIGSSHVAAAMLAPWALLVSL
jgi:hypothetical protein